MLAALAKWGITPKFHRPDWRTYNRNAAQGWGPLYGFVVHCFGSDGGDSGSLDYLRTGDPLPPPQGRGLPGPLSQFAITDDGQVWIIAWGTANHMGSIDPRLHALVLKDAAPMSSDFVPNVNFKSPGAMHNVNDNYLGVEMTYGKAPTAAQRKSVALLGAALMDALGTGYTAGSVIGHREATTDRSDPTGVPMWQLRREIDALLKAGPAGAPTQEDDMAMTPAERAAFIADIRDAVLSAPVPRPGDASGATWPLRTALWSANTYAYQAATKSLDVDAIAAKVGAALPESSGVSKEALTAAIKAAFASLGGDVPEPPKPAA
jgi:hypothetical protein